MSFFLRKIPGPLLTCILQLLNQRLITLLDVGASGGIHDRWNLIGSQLLAIGFEPDPGGYRRLTETKSPNRIWLPYALYKDNGEFPLYITRHPSNISMLQPNPSAMNLLDYDLCGLDIVNKLMVDCRTADSISQDMSIPIDAIKVDTQGTELYILQGACQALRSHTFCIESEVEFFQMYQD